MTERPPGGRLFSRLRGRLQPESPASAAALTGTLAVLALGALVYAAYGAVFQPTPFVILPKTLRFFGPHEISTHVSLIKAFFDARGQTLAHLAVAGGTALLALWGAPFGPPRAAVRVGGLAGLGVAAAGLLSPLYAPGPKGHFFLAAVPVGFLLLLAGRRRPRSWTNALLGAATLVAVALATFPGFLGPPDFSGQSWYDLTYSEGHWSLVIAPGDLLAQGRRLLVDVRPEYGVVLPVLWAAGQRAFGAFSMGDSVHALMGLQALYLGLSVWLLWRAARGRWLFAIVALAAVVPWYHFAHHSLLFPNQTAWRIVGMPLALATLWVLPTLRPWRQAFYLGAVAAGALLLNPESGVAVTAGLSVFLFFRHRASLDRRPLIGLVAPFLGGLLVAGGAFVLVCWILLGAPVPLGLLPRQVLGKAAFLTSTGFSGFRWTPDPWPVFILGHAVFVLVQSAFAPPRASSGFRPSFRAASATVLLVWFAYYANRPDPWNLSSYYLLYGLLLVDLLRYVALGVARRRVSARLLAAAALLVALVLPNVVAISVKGAQQVTAALGPALRREAPAGGGLLSGVYLSKGPAEELPRRADFIRARSAESPVYVTADSYLIPKLSGVFSAMPVLDFCWEALTRKTYDRTLDEIVRSPSGRLYLDAPDTGAFYTICGAFYRQVRHDLAETFEKAGEEQGWEVWTRKR